MVTLPASGAPAQTYFASRPVSQASLTESALADPVVSASSDPAPAAGSGSSRETTVSASADKRLALLRSQESRKVRYHLHDLAHSILPSDSRECACHHLATDSASVALNKDTGLARCRGVVRCGNVWVCPICAPVIAVQRAQAIDDVLRAATYEELTVLKLALTCAHSRDDALGDLLDRQVKAIRSFKGSRPVRRILKSLGYQGSITAKEATWGPVNGWHPHQHEYWFVMLKPEKLKALKSELSAEWLKALARHGLVGSKEHALFLGLMKPDEIEKQTASGYLVKAGTAAGYLVKAGTAAGLELSGGVLKQGKKTANKAGHYSPMELLAVNEGWSKKLFLEFYHAFKKRKQLVFSKSILKIYGSVIGGSLDECGIVMREEEPAPNEETVLHLQHGQLQALREFRQAVRVLELVESGQVGAAADLIDSVYAAWVDRRYRFAVDAYKRRGILFDVGRMVV